MRRMRLKLARQSYPIVVGSQILEQLPRLIQETCPEGKLFVFVDANVFALHGQILKKYLKRSKRSWAELVVPSGERTKSRAQLQRLEDYLLAERVSRNDLILAVGGGVLSDLVGFAAASCLRGINWAVLPTTLLGMVDAAIGGKTGINHRLGKNLIGAFWQPQFVLSDVCFLNTLPEREMVAGLGEAVKYGGLLGGPMMAKTAGFLSAHHLYDQTRLEDLVTRSSRCKATIVAQDEREAGQRMFLNLGHTVGHAIETSLGHGRLRHGEAVILGLLAALELSRKISGNSRALDKYETLVETLLPLLPKRSLSADKIMEAMTIDKKRRGQRLRFVLLERPGRPFIEERVSNAQVRRAVAKMIDTYREKGR